jgi:hypothetical protein
MQNGNKNANQKVNAKLKIKMICKTITKKILCKSKRTRWYSRRCNLPKIRCLHKLVTKTFLWAILLLVPWQRRWWCGVDVGVLYMTAQLETPREGYDEHNNKSSLSVKPRFIEPVGERTNFQRLMPACFVTALDNICMAPYPGHSFAPAATWNLHTTQPSTLSQLTVRLSISLVCCEQRIKRIEW